MISQLERMRAFGFDGTVFHPRFYPNDPPYLGEEYLAVLSRVILHAKSLGMDFWIYDENGWPSGTVGGELLRVHPGDRQQWAELTLVEPDTGDVLGSFTHEGLQWFVVRRLGEGVDYLNPELARHFLAMTYERYRTGLDARAFAHVSAFFSDEPEFGLGHAYDRLSTHGAIPWTPRLAEIYWERYGEPLADQWRAIFFPGDRGEQARIRLWETLTDLFCDSFIDPLNEWCRSYGKRLTAHLKGEEHPLFQVPTHGSAQRVFRHLSLPAIDALERDPSNDFFPRQLASAARQFGDGRSMVECFGGAGWGAGPEDFRRYLLWLGAHGISDYVVHLWQYRLTSHAIRDWPASIPNHLGWADAFGPALARIKEEIAAAARASGVDRAETLLISPHRGIMAKFDPRELLTMNVHNGSNYAETPAGRINDRFMASVEELQRSRTAYHIADERTFESGEVEGAALVVGNCRYTTVMLSDDCVLRPEGRELLRGLQAAGGVVAPATVASASDLAMPQRRLVEQAAMPMPLDWSIDPLLENDFPLELMAVEEAERFAARFIVAEALPDAQIIFADDIDEAQVNGHQLSLQRSWRESSAPVAGSRFVVGENVLRIRAGGISADPQARPMAWLRGAFAVAAGGFAAGPNQTVINRGSFTLKRAPTVYLPDLTSSGFPFARGPVTAGCAVVLGTAGRRLKFEGVAGDVARLWIDDTDCGFFWGPEWSIDLPTGVAAGKHALKLTIYPSAFNRFGPHHHIDGDIHIVSPIQYQGVKNFADRADAPDKTSVPWWHVKAVRFPGGVWIE